MNVLEVRGVKKFFSQKLVLDDVNFEIGAGECLGIVGLSGGGKSTLAKWKLPVQSPPADIRHPILRADNVRRNFLASRLRPKVLRRARADCHCQ